MQLQKEEKSVMSVSKRTIIFKTVILEKLAEATKENSVLNNQYLELKTNFSHVKHIYSGCVF